MIDALFHPLLRLLRIHLAVVFMPGMMMGMAGSLVRIRGNLRSESADNGRRKSGGDPAPAASGNGSRRLARLLCVHHKLLFEKSDDVQRALSVAHDCNLEGAHCFNMCGL
ncbi:MAG TPA: hypothetical protein VFM11_10935 [Burkholderiales bacterium]|nr:hypothetical protein [Burkholderiales bacterium]